MSRHPSLPLQSELRPELKVVTGEQGLARGDDVTIISKWPHSTDGWYFEDADHPVYGSSTMVLLDTFEGNVCYRDGNDLWVCYCVGGATYPSGHHIGIKPSHHMYEHYTLISFCYDAKEGKWLGFTPILLTIEQTRSWKYHTNKSGLLHLTRNEHPKRIPDHR